MWMPHAQKCSISWPTSSNRFKPQEVCSDWAWEHSHQLNVHVLEHSMNCHCECRFELIKNSMELRSGFLNCRLFYL